MNKIKLAPFLVMLSLCVNLTKAQTNRGRAFEYLAGEMLFGVGLNVVSDGGIKNMSETLHFSNPFIVGAEYTITNQFSVNASLSFNKYKVGKVLEGEYVIQEPKEPLYSAFDVVAKFYVREALNLYDIEPYLFVGTGTTTIGSYVNQAYAVDKKARMTINTGFGANYWFSARWGANVNFMGKWGTNKKDKSAHITNQMQFAFGVFYSPKVINWRS